MPQIYRTNRRKAKTACDKKWTLEWLRDLDMSCRRILAILVLINKSHADITEIIFQPLCDLDLPLAGQGPDCLLSSRYNSTSRIGLQRIMSCFYTQDWTAEDRKQSHRMQWSLLAQVIEMQKDTTSTPTEHTTSSSLGQTALSAICGQ